MHYRPYQFTKTNLPTITPKPGKYKEGLRIGEKKYMSDADVIRVQRLYGCPVDTTHINKLDPKQVALRCGFDDPDVCGLVQDPNDDFDWTIGKDNSPVPKGAVFLRDYNSAAGNYAFVQATGHYNQVARFSFKQTFPAGSYCLRYASLLEGSDLGSLKYSILFENGSKRDRIHKPSGRGYWRRRYRNWSMSSPWRLAFEYRTGKGPEANVAIDDIQLLKGRCQSR